MRVIALLSLPKILLGSKNHALENLSARETNHFRRHLYLDLQPYMCLDVSCSYSNTAFENREKWISHLALEHEMEPNWESMKCFLCKEATGSGKSAITRHFSKHLEEISLTALPVEVNSNPPSDNGSELYDSDDDGENSSRAQDKGKSRAVSGNALVNKKHNRPCNTIYARNLPARFEEEVKAAFSKQQGYKGIKMMGAPNASTWCFFEFENTLSATKAFHNLNGQLLHNSIKGGIRLKFFNKHPDNPVLPRQWIAEFDEESQRWFYSNPGTGVAQWEVPLVDPPYNPPSNVPPLPPGWIPYFDNDAQRWVYNNPETRLTQRKFPLTNPPYIPPSDKPPIPQGWIPLFDPGYQQWFYANQETGRTQWEPPQLSQTALSIAERQVAQEVKEHTTHEGKQTTPEEERDTQEAREQGVDEAENQAAKEA